MNALVVGVPVDRLTCPTCRDTFRPAIDVLLPEPSFLDDVRPHEFAHGRAYTMTCASGHRWSIKEMTMDIQKPTTILLGE